MGYERDRPAPAPDWDTIRYLVENGFGAEAAKRLELKDKRDQIDQEIEEQNAVIGGMLATANLTSVRFGNHVMIRGQSMSGGRLSRERLLELGVSADVLEQATTPRVGGKEYISIRPLKGADSGSVRHED